MPKIILTVGLPASGKSTWAKEEVRKSGGRMKRVNKDDLRAMLDCGGKWSGDKEKFVLKMRDAVVTEAMLKGLDVIIDDTNLHPKHINHIKQMVENWNILCDRVESAEFRADRVPYTVEINDSFLQTSYKECVRRDLARPVSVGEKVIRQMYIQYVLKVDKLEQDKDLPHAIICDLDGTLALFGNKNPYDRDFENDVVNKQVRDVLDMFVHQPYSRPHIIFLSGRSDKYKEITEKWIGSKAGLPFITWELHMRKEGDSRSDMIVKKELFNEHVKGKYYVDFVIDDRLQIIDVWHAMGLFVFNVNQTNEEF